MIRVKNREVIARISKKSLRASKTRNLIAVTAIILTTVLFTTLFTIDGTIVNSFEQANFRQVGGDAHGTFKYITKEQIEELASDSLVESSGTRLLLGMPMDIPFHKTHVEVSYMDETCAKGYFCEPEVGTLPKEGTNQIACDTRILELLQVEPKLGTEIQFSYYIGGNTEEKQLVTDTFILSGWWTYDEASVASHAIAPLSYVSEVLEEYAPYGEGNTTGTWDLNVYFKSTNHIEKDMNTILEKHGYQSEDGGKDNYINIGVNWAYLGAQLSGNMDVGTMAAVIVLCLVFMLTGYLIIYNIFQISVVNDIKFYGLLKTIGTTKKQIQRIIYRQAFYLSFIGIPAGLVLGYLFGNILAPVIMSTLSYKNTFTTGNPLIFICATLFSLITILISCRKPGKIAGKVSPVEAVRYTENTGGKKKIKKGNGKVTVYHMALANLGRNCKKTVLVILSLSLAVVMLQIVFTFANGFDMDKYLRTWVVSDYIVGFADYFQPGKGGVSSQNSVPELAISDINRQGKVTEGGRIYGISGGVQDFVTEEWYRAFNGRWNDQETVDHMLKFQDINEKGLIANLTQLYGMEEYPLSQLDLVEGDISALHDPTQNAIAAVYWIDDYEHPIERTQWAKVGDQVTLRYVDEWEDYDMRTGEVVTDIDSIPLEYVNSRVSKSHEVTYTVVATVTMRGTMGYRYYSSNQYVLNGEVFKRDTKTSDIMTYLFNTTESSNDAMNHFLSDYTENIEPTLDFESKQSYVDEFSGFRNMFVLMGTVLSTIVGLVGILNFLNAVITSIMTRRHEFAMLRSIGMTGKQLRKMLIVEGLFYALFSIAISFTISILTGPLLSKAMSSMFWFFSYRFTLFPFALVTPIFIFVGIVIPFVSYHITTRYSIVEQLRGVE